MKGYLSFNLTDESRYKLLSKFNPLFGLITASHVTYKFNVDSTESIPNVFEITVIGYSKNNKIECVVVSVCGETLRPDGKLYHITISHTENSKPVESNYLLEEAGITPIEPFNLEVKPRFIPF